MVQIKTCNEVESLTKTLITFVLSPMLSLSPVVKAYLYIQTVCFLHMVRT